MLGRRGRQQRLECAGGHVLALGRVDSTQVLEQGMKRGAGEAGGFGIERILEPGREDTLGRLCLLDR